MLDVLGVIGKSLAISLGIGGAIIGVIILITLFMIRSTVRDKVFGLFLSESKQLSSKLLKPKLNTVVIGTGDDEVKYLLHPTKFFWSAWPPGFPRFMQEPVQTLFYVEGNAEPLDPYDRTSLVSPGSLRKISDEAMLRQTWKDVRESLGLKSAFGGGNTLLMMGIVAAVVMAGIAAYMSYTNAAQTSAVLRMLGG